MRIITLVCVLCAILKQGMAQNQSNEIYDKLKEAYDYLGTSPDSCIIISKSLIRENDGDFIQGVGFKNIGIAHQLKHNIDTAYLFLQKADSCLAKLDSLHIEKIKVQSQLGSITWAMGNIDAAKNYFTRALSDAKSIDNYYMMAYIQKELSKFYFYLEDYTLSEGFANNSLKIYQDPDYGLDDIHSQIELYNSLGNCYEKDSSKDAEPLLKKAIDLAKSNNEAFLLAVTETNYANFLVGQDRFKEAIGIYKRTIAVFKLNKRNSFQSAPTQINMGIAYLGLNDYEQAEEHLLTGLKNAQKQNLISYQITAHTNLSILYRKKGNELDYYSHKLSAMELKNKLLTSQQDDAMGLLQKEFETELNDKKNALLMRENQFSQERISAQNKVLWIIVTGLALVLIFSLVIFAFWIKSKKQNVIIDIKNLELTNLNKKKDQMLSIISHDLRSPIVQLLQLQTAYQDEGLNDEMRHRMGDKILQKTQSGLQMLENMLEWTNKYLRNETEIKIVKLDLLVDSIINEQQQYANSKLIQIQNYMQNSMIKADEDLIRIIIRNFINNAIKFSETSSTIKIYHQTTDFEFTICVEDEGNGMPESIMNNINGNAYQKLNPGIGTKAEYGAGLGLQLSKDFARKMNAKIRVLKSDKSGTIMTLVFGLNVLEETKLNPNQ